MVKLGTVTGMFANFMFIKESYTHTNNCKRKQLVGKKRKEKEEKTKKKTEKNTTAQIRD
jgi:hypothetical protein